VRQELKQFQKKVEQANEEINKLNQILHNKEQRINELKKKRTGITDTIAEIQQMKAAKQQMIVQNKQTHQELRIEFTGINL
jgi:predicted  nucleic acid-binding Zn-ribbon protein